jgi:tetratricopeptide (TPR) repeat protein
MRIMLPRLLYQSFYYPFSERVFRLICERFREFHAGKIADPPVFSLAETEGTDLSTIWEPAWYETYEADTPPVIVADGTGTLVDVRLLMKKHEYSRIVGLYPSFRRNPTPEFAHYLYWANVILGNEIATNAQSVQFAQAQRLLSAARERFATALQILPDKPDAHILLGETLHRLKQYSLALASYDKALKVDDTRYDAWTGRAVTLLKLDRFDEALASVNKSISLSKEPKMQMFPLLMRSYIHLRSGHIAEASNDLIDAWTHDPERLIGDLEYHDLMEAICVRSQSAEAILLQVELYSRQATDASDGATGLALEKANAAILTLNKLKPRDDKDETQRLTSIDGGLVYDVLTRAAGYLVNTKDKQLALACIGQMQTWALSILGEPFDSLTDYVSELER